MRAQEANANTADAQGDGLDGVDFKYYRLDLDLTKPEGWKPLNDLDVPAEACSPRGEANFDELNAITQDMTTAVVTTSTENGGKAQATVTTGAYLVCEQPSLNVTNKNGEKVSVVKKAKAFVVTVPTPHPGGSGWLHDIHVYPKNTVSEAPVKTMTVNKDGLEQENAVSIEVATKIPSLGQEEQVTYFTIVDPMPAELANPDNYAASIAGTNASLVMAKTT